MVKRSRVVIYPVTMTTAVIVVAAAVVVASSSSNVDSCFDKQVSMVKMCNHVVNNLHKIENCCAFVSNEQSQANRIVQIHSKMLCNILKLVGFKH